MYLEKVKEISRKELETIKNIIIFAPAMINNNGLSAPVA